MPITFARRWTLSSLNRFDRPLAISAPNTLSPRDRN
jgi:hypothetical protein